MWGHHLTRSPLAFPSNHSSSGLAVSFSHISDLDQLGYVDQNIPGSQAKSLYTIINSCHSPIRGQRVHAIQSIQCNYMEPSQMLSAMRRIHVLASVICLEKLSIVWASRELVILKVRYTSLHISLETFNGLCKYVLSWLH